MRLHQPVGIWLLLWPCWWSIALASDGFPSLKILLLFVLGAVLMRSAGCIVNDIADRDIDRQVERTRTRPLASGELTMAQAVALLLLLLALSFMVAMALGPVVVLWAALALLPVAIYPWMKRISWWPQLFLGLTFNWGALMGWAAVRGTVEWPAIALYIGGIFWTLGYDTIYAHQDKKDDARIGIKSTARRLGENTKPAVAVFYLLALAGWVAAAALAGSSLWSFACLFATGLHLFWQVKKVNLDDPISCRRIFVSNAALGWLAFAGFLAESL
jgi:4-hydroxybenzoate polyprenyltransferase